MQRGPFIVLEGIDGSGTTTQRAALQARLQQSGWRVHATAEPTEGPIGGLIRDALTGARDLAEDTLALLFAADRIQHVNTTIAPRLRDGELVLCDRYLLSSLAYQSVQLPLPWVLEINAQALRPDLTVLLDVGPEVAADRRRHRGSAPERFDALERQRAVAENYQRLVQRSDIGQVRIVDANGPAAAVREALATTVCNWLQSEYVHPQETP